MTQSLTPKSFVERLTRLKTLEKRRSMYAVTAIFIHMYIMVSLNKTSGMGHHIVVATRLAPFLFVGMLTLCCCSVSLTLCHEKYRRLSYWLINTRNIVLFVIGSWAFLHFLFVRNKDQPEAIDLAWISAALSLSNLILGTFFIVDTSFASFRQFFKSALCACIASAPFVCVGISTLGNPELRNAMPSSKSISSFLIHSGAIYIVFGSVFRFFGPSARVSKTSRWAGVISSILFIVGMNLHLGVALFADPRAIDTDSKWKHSSVYHNFDKIKYLRLPFTFISGLPDVTIEVKHVRALGALVTHLATLALAHVAASLPRRGLKSIYETFQLEGKVVIDGVLYEKVASPSTVHHLNHKDKNS